MLTQLFRTVDKMPFAGKFGIEASMKAYVRSRPSREKLGFAGNVAILGSMIAAHALQSYLGVEAFDRHLESLGTANGNATDGSFMALDAAYALTTAAVSVRQVALLGRLNQTRKRKNITYLERLQEDRPAGFGTANTKIMTPARKRWIASMVTAAAFTYGAQTAFGASYYDSTNPSEQGSHSCVEDAQANIALLQRDGLENSIDPVAASWADICKVSPADIVPVPKTMQKALD